MADKSLRIAMISEHASPMALLGGEDAGGQNVYVDELSRALAVMGHQVDVFTRRDSWEAKEINSWADGVRVVNVGAGPSEILKKDLLLPYMPAFRDNMLAFMQQQRVQYDVIHGHFWMSGWVACELKAVLGVPIVETFHALGAIKKIYQGSADTSPKERPAVENRILEDMDTIIATCPAEVEDLRTYYSVDESKVSIVPCGVNTQMFRPVNKLEAREHIGIAPDEQIVVYIGRILPRKDVDNVIQGVAELLRAGHDDLRLVVVGGESEDPNSPANFEIRRLMHVADNEGIRDRVVFTGKRQQSELKYFYSAADVCVTTPWYEPFGMTPLESMACGTPVIAADVGGLKYSVLEGVTGLHVPPKHPRELAAKLDLLLDNPQLVQEMSRNSIKRVKRMFTWQTIASSIARVYDRVIQSRELYGLRLEEAGSDQAALQ